MSVITDIMLEDARKHLVPELKRIVPVDDGDLKRSISAADYEGQHKRNADRPKEFLVQKIVLIIGQVKHTIVVGAVEGRSRLGITRSEQHHPVTYGHIRYSVDKAFRNRWDRAIDKYEREFVSRIDKALARRIFT